ncbi:MAG: leucine-rich repeat protein [Lachnospiraceae bacterium]|nr:leucine-rich repeat protein [Lachnospiraceae bacterium]
MQDLVTKYLEKFKKERRSRRRLGSALLALALIVTIVVYWQLKLTGAALTNETYCGKIEHTHDSEECYEWVLVCGYDDVTETSVTLEELELLWEEYDGDMEAAAAAMESAGDISGDSAATTDNTGADTAGSADVTEAAGEVTETTETTAETAEIATEAEAAGETDATTGDVTETAEDATEAETAGETDATTGDVTETVETATETEAAEGTAGTTDEVTEPTESVAETGEKTVETTNEAGTTEDTSESARDITEPVEETAETTGSEAETVEETTETAEEVTEPVEETTASAEPAAETETVEETVETAEEAAETTGTAAETETAGETVETIEDTTAEVLGANIEDAAATDAAEATEDISAATDDTTTTSNSESSTHVHTAACYQKVLVCTLEEHTHTVECLSDVTADVETAEDWEATLPSELSDDWAEAVVAVAQSQFGYTESIANFTLADDGETHQGYTRYGAWAGNAYGDWNAMFASFCLHYAGISTEDFPESTGAYAWTVKLQELGLYADAASYTPVSGDLVFFDTDEDGKIDRVGIVISVIEEPAQLTVIEGDYAADADTADAVCANQYALNDACLIGFGTVAAAQEAAGKTVSTDVELVQQTLTLDADGATITISGLLPEDATVTAEPVDVKIEGKTVLLAFDISILYLDADGNETVYEPQDGAITVIIESDEITGSSDVYYVPDDGEPEELENEAEDGVVSFDAEHFSTYAVTSSETVYASGTIANADGEADAITWTLYQDIDGNLTTLVISGSGAIPDYSGGSSTPWFNYINNNTNIAGVALVIEDGITGIGTYAFNNNIITSLDIGSDVTYINTSAFQYVRNLSSVTIPGNVKTVAGNAFMYANSLTSVTLEEGVESVGQQAFYSQTGGVSYTVSLPGSVTYVSGGAFLNASSYEFYGEGIATTMDGYQTNVIYTIVDGVLYSADLTTLADYPSARVENSYRLLDSTTNIASKALAYLSGTKEIIVPGSVKTYGGNSVGGFEFQHSSSLESVVFEDGANASGNNMFENCSNLTSLTLPDTEGLSLRQCYINSCKSLETLTIPSGTTSIYGLNNNTTILNLDTLIYDAGNATNIAGSAQYNYVFSAVASYNLIIGTDVDTLIANFDYIVQHAGSITFQGPNFITVTEGAFNSAASTVLKDLSGYIYIDKYGAIYLIDTEAETASLLYVPSTYLNENDETQKLTSYTVPTTIVNTEDENNTEYNVTSVASNAFHDAINLTALTFEDASQISQLGDYAMANATKLASVTDEKTSQTVTTEEGALALFTGATGNVGYKPFYNTALGGASGTSKMAEDMDGSDSLTITAVDNGSAQLVINVSGGTWSDEDEDNQGGYTLLTGKTLTINVAASAPSATDTHVYRVYLSYTDIDSVLNYNAEGYDGEWHTTDDPNTVYLEFTVSTEETTSFTLTTYYPNITSDGGGLTIWGEVLTANEAQTAGTNTQPTDSAETIQAWWETSPDTYIVTKGNASQDSVTLYAEDGTIRFASSLTYEIETSISGDTYTNGRDFATSAYYEDILTLPQGVTWDSTVLQAIKNNEVYYQSGTLYIYDSDGEKVQIASIAISSGTDVSLSGVNVKYVEGSGDTEGYVVLYWTVKNSSSSSSLSATKVALSIAPAATVVTDVSKLASTEETTTNTITKDDGTTEETTTTTTVYKKIDNSVTATFKYTYSEDKYAAASVKKDVKVEEGTLDLSKSVDKTSGYFGEDVTYTLVVSNTKALKFTASDTGEYTLVDELDYHTYISAENMEEMFKEAAGRGYPLTIEIAEAVLGVSDTATDTTGDGTVNLNAGNTSSTSVDKITVTLTITYDSVSQYYTVSYVNEKSVTVKKEDSSLADILQKLGYGVTNTATYTCTWVLGGGETTTDADGNPVISSFELNAGESLTFRIPATTKDTFQMLLNDDRQNRYDLTATYTAKNNAYVRTTGKSGNVKTANASTTLSREAYIRKAVYSEDGVLLTSDPSAADGDVLEYRLTFRHEGNGEYDDLPMVDDIYGSQQLLVPYTENKSNDSITQNIYDETTNPGGTVTIYTADDGTQYYVLGKGTYNNVLVGTSGNTLLMADTITVEYSADEVKSEDGTEYTGYHTEIKWYFDHLDGGDYTIEVRYQTLVQYEEDEIEYSIGNVVWMNDRTGSRIYDGIWGGGTMIDFEKHLVVDENETNETKVDEYDNSTGAEGADGYDDNDYSTISAGETVTYCLILSGHGGGTFTLNGDDLWDLLPETYNVFDWVKDANVTLRYEFGEGIEISGTQTADDGTTTTDIDLWTIEAERSGSRGSWIKWPENMTITFSSSAQLKIYVTLTFPSADDEDGTWDKYVEEAGGSSLVNTLYVRNFTSTVTHDLTEKASVILQKGVYGEATEPTKSAPSYQYTPTDVNLNYFNNQDSYFRYVVYYVTVYNAGNTKLYLSELTDTLPDGYTYVQLVGSTSGLLNGREYQSTTTKSAITVTGGSSENLLITGLPNDTSYKTATITKSGDGSDISFTVTGSSGNYALSYDEDLQMYYLEKGEALVFGYICRVGSYSETGDTATNTISMDYYDYLGMGVSQVAKEDSNYNLTGTDVVYNSKTYYANTSNDGSRDVTDDGNTITLSSTVKQTLAEIVPGISKSFVGYKDSTGTIHTENVTSLYGYDSEVVYWSATLTNDGGRSITDYTVTDTMPNPYVFEGDVTMTVYSSSEATSASEVTLFSIGTRTANDSSVTITSGTQSYTLTINGDSLRIRYGNYGGESYMVISLSTDSDGNEILTVRFEGVYFAIPESGKIVLNYSSRSPSGGTTYSTYVNNVKLDPDGAFDSKGEGILENDEDGDMEAVSANASITVSGAYATSSAKSVTELGSDGNTTNNTASSDSSSNSIVLSAEDSTFRYSLDVHNLTNYAMTKLVVIDNLPAESDIYAVGTTERGSEFTVELAGTPDFTVYVTTEDENGDEIQTALNFEYYEIQYSSTETEFTTEDYAGGNTSSRWQTWTSSVEANNVRAIRIIITDEVGTQIPAGAIVTIEFAAVASFEDGTSIEPSAIAWNNFGYHYALKDVPTELTAMPLVVGVQVPSAPRLTKKLVGLDGTAYEAESDTKFTFVIYKGEELTDSEGKSYTTQSDLEAALRNESREHRIVTLTVNKGESSGTLSLIGSNGLGANESWWTWTQGQEYTIAEFLSDDSYELQSWSASGGISTDAANGNSYTFTYDREKELRLTCTNTYEVWDLTLTKVDADSYDAESDTYTKKLSGAVFALYSRVQPSPEVTSSNGAASTIDVNGTTWYLYKESKSDNGGEITWNGLTEESYYIVEVKAPDGYNLDFKSHEISRTSNSESITVTNEAGYVLPKSGGIGTGIFTLLGLMLCGGAAVMLWSRRRRA